jgi:hypothetical protein
LRIVCAVLVFYLVFELIAGLAQFWTAPYGLGGLEVDHQLSCVLGTCKRYEPLRAQKFEAFAGKITRLDGETGDMNPAPGKDAHGELDPTPGIREQPRHSRRRPN